MKIKTTNTNETPFIPSSSSSSASRISEQQMEYKIKERKPRGKPNKTAVNTGLPFHMSANEVLASKYARYSLIAKLFPP